MRILSPLLLAATLSLAPLTAVRAEAASLTVTGTASVEATPDLATLSLGVTTTGETAASAMSANSAALAAVIDRLKSAGVEGRDIQTSNLSLNPNWVSRFVGHRQRNSGLCRNQHAVNVRIRALDKTGAVLDAAISDGANALNGLYFGLQDPRPVEDQARKLAVADALARAKLFSDAAGVKLGSILSITDSAMAQPVPGPMYRMADAAAAVPVEAGSLGISASVTIVFQIGE